MCPTFADVGLMLWVTKSKIAAKMFLIFRINDCLHNTLRAHFIVLIVKILIPPTSFPPFLILIVLFELMFVKTLGLAILIIHRASGGNFRFVSTYLLGLGMAEDVF